MKEIYELIASGVRYFSGWQLVVNVGLLLHITVIGLRYYHHTVSNFSKGHLAVNEVCCLLRLIRGLATSSEASVSLDIATFEEEARVPQCS